jgi:hypothetical protein
MTKTKYGVKLLHYGDNPPYQQFDMWIYEGKGRFETTCERKAHELQHKYSTKNPKGFYQVVVITED